MPIDSKDGQTTKKTRAGRCEENVFRTESDIVVFELGGPVIEEGVFQTETDQQTIQRGAGLSGGANDGAVYSGRVPVESAGYPPRFAVDKRPVKGDTKAPGNIVIPFIFDAGGSNQGAAGDATKLIVGNFHPGPEAFTLDTENEHADLVVAADLATGETADAVPVNKLHTPWRLKSLIKQHAGAAVHADIATGPAEDRCGQRKAWAWQRYLQRRPHRHMRWRRLPQRPKKTSSSSCRPQQKNDQNRKI
jgi:hypothetical protein